MTAEEAIKEIRDASDNEVRYGDTEHHYNEVMKRIEAFDIAIKALEQDPCEDAVSRQAVKETIFEQGSAEKLEIDFAKLLLLQRAIKALPSVTPQPKIGHWIRWYEVIESADGKSTDHIPHCKCSECGTEYEPHSSQFIKYCSNCGIRIGEEEA